MFCEYSNKRLLKADYNKSCQDLAVYLLGKILVRKLKNGEILRGQIVETEGYLGGEDKASHSYKGKVTQRNEPMYMAAGTLYVYTIYFGYHCLNISSVEPGAVVLLRALQPLSGMNIMENFRIAGTKSKPKKKIIKPVDLCNGPSKLCIALDITKHNSNKLDLTDLLNDEVWIEEGRYLNNFSIVNAPRIGIGTSAEEWAVQPLRYYILHNESVSKRDKKAEKFALTLNTYISTIS